MRTVENTLAKSRDYQVCCDWAGMCEGEVDLDLILDTYLIFDTKVTDISRMCSATDIFSQCYRRFERVL